MSGQSDSVYLSEGSQISLYTTHQSRVKFKGFKITDESAYYISGTDPTTVSTNDVQEGDIWINTSNNSVGYIYVTQQHLDEYGTTSKYTASIGGGWIESAVWWLRSPNVGSSAHFWYVGGSGYCSGSYSAGGPIGICP